jgi:hypothetical protein
VLSGSNVTAKAIPMLQDKYNKNSPRTTLEQSFIQTYNTKIGHQNKHRKWPFGITLARFQRGEVVSNRQFLYY